MGLCGLGVFGDLKVLDKFKTKKFAVMEVVEGHVMVAIAGLDMVDGMAAVVVVTLVLGVEFAVVLDSKRVFSNILTLYCLLPTW